MGGGKTALFFFSFALVILSSCSHFVRRPQELKPALEPKIDISHEEVSSPVYSFKGPYQSHYPDPPSESHPDVDLWINYFTGKGRENMQLYLERSSRYIPLMKSVLRENHLPEDLVYIALIESGFSPKALSRANAVGYWQFIYGTGKRYGLRIDGYVDERRDPVFSTRAASNFFKDLYSLFESWPLAFAGYNAGEHRVHRAVLRHYNRNFWFLSEKKALPRETRNYIPKFIAAMRIAKNPQQYGFRQLNWQEPINYELLPVPHPVSLVKLAQGAGIPIEEMKALNPMYKGEYVPVYEGEGLSLRVPVGSLQLAQAVLGDSQMKKPKTVYYHWYRARRGDSLSRIARKHRTTVRRIQRENNMGRRTFIRAGQRLKIPSQWKKKSAQRRVAAKAAGGEFHTVRRGQSLSLIAKRYGLKIAELKAFNNMHGEPLIHPGDRLRIKKAVQPAAKDKDKSYYTVRQGETLIGIAKKHNIPLPQLLKANAMSFKSVLLTGTKLVIPR